MSKAIELRGVGKRYRINEGAPLLANRLRRSRHRDLWALRDVDLEVEPGETIGVIGRNGSGKTSLLRLLSGVSAPTTGTLRVVGQIAPLIGIGVGFHPEMTGRENVRVNARMLGLSAAQVAARFDQIVAFSEIESFLDTPVKYYSSGMFLRLGFAIAIHTDPQVLLVDEVLAVGDLAFQLKCLDRMREVQQQGTTIVLVTHNLPSLDRMAPRAVLLDKGQVRYDGPVAGALSAYHAALDGGGDRPEGEPAGAQVQVSLLDEAGNEERHFKTGARLRLKVHVTFDEEVRDPLLGVMVAPLGMGASYSLNTTPGSYVGSHGPGRPLDAEVTLTNRMLDGSYSVWVGVHSASGGRQLGCTEPMVFYVSSHLTQARGTTDLEGHITVAGQEIAQPGRQRLGDP
ncbi:MAG: ABC-type polysaccharide/polyol phosphate transport system, ATPase component [Frankiales bacterium]|nr:ABC-type polysaccharide/polyol phosphate transport system, ATPase component [Frankiales bacterium]